MIIENKCVSGVFFSVISVAQCENNGVVVAVDEVQGMNCILLGSDEEEN